MLLQFNLFDKKRYFTCKDEQDFFEAIKKQQHSASKMFTYSVSYIIN